MNDTSQIISKKEFLKSIDFETRTVKIVPSKPKKITGTRLSAILGKSKYKTPFAAACDMVRLYTLVEETKYTNAGHVIEPKIREHVRSISDSLSDRIGAKGKMGVEEPIPAELCWYDHFRDTPVFGGMVDGYVTCDGERRAVLEIKTSHDRTQWFDENGEMSKVPEDYMMQASLYCELSGLDTIVFAVGFLEEDDYDRPEEWKIADGNFYVMVVKKRDISKEMSDAKAWLDNMMKTCTLPQWTDEDLEIIDYLTTKQLRMVSVSLEKLISEYVRSGMKEEFEPEIKRQLIGYFSGCERKMTYVQDGYSFSIVMDDDYPEFIVLPKQ